LKQKAHSRPPLPLLPPKNLSAGDVFKNVKDALAFMEKAQAPAGEK
jgi:hypothetical protein